MFTEEFDYDRAIEIAKEEAREDGKAESTASNIKKLMKNLKLTAEAAMELLEVPKSDYSRYAAML